MIGAERPAAGGWAAGAVAAPPVLSAGASASWPEAVPQAHRIKAVARATRSHRAAVRGATAVVGFAKFMFVVFRDYLVSRGRPPCGARPRLSPSLLLRAAVVRARYRVAGRR